MAAKSLQPRGSALLLDHPVPSSGQDQQRNLIVQQLILGSANVDRTSISPSTLRGIGQCQPCEENGAAVANSSPGAAQELLRRQLLLDCTLWSERCADRRSSRSPDFTYRPSDDVLWLSNFWKPAWVNDRLAGPGLPTFIHSVRGTPGIPGNESGTAEEAITELCEKGQLSEAVDALECLVVEAESCISTYILRAVLKGCVAQKDLALGRRVHDIVVRVGYESNTILGNFILRMYASLGTLQEVKNVFTRVASPDVFSWSAVIAAHTKHGQPKQAIQLYQDMRSLAIVKPDPHVFVAALQACGRAADIESGRQVHADVLVSDVHPNLFIWNCLVDMYARCGRLEDARSIFDGLLTRSVVTWNAMITGYADHERGREALSLYEQMEEEGAVLPNAVTFVCLLRACAKVGNLQKGKQLQLQVQAKGLASNVLVSTCLIDMYAKCGELEDARSVFDSLPTKDVVTWNAMIAGYAKCGRLEDARRVFDRLDTRHVTTCNTMISGYAKFGRMEDAERLFDSLMTRDVVTWNTMMGGYAEHGLGQEALGLYAIMEQEGMMIADPVTYVCLLKACASVGDLENGKHLHTQIVERGLETDTTVVNCLVHMYAKCGRLEEARRAFDNLPIKDVVTWTTMITGCAEHGLGQESLALYARMEEEGVIVADSVTFACLLKACAAAAALQQGKQLHERILERGLEVSALLGSCLVDMYAKCGKLSDACRVFGSSSKKSVVMWNAMINGFGKSNEGHKAVECFQEMMRSGVKPDETTFTCLLIACSHEGLVQEGKHLFKVMKEDCGIVPTIEHNNCMVDLLGRAGYLDEAEELLLSSDNDHVGLTSLLSACKSHGDVERGTRCFHRLISLDSQSATAYVLMGNIYANAGRWPDVDRIESLRKSVGANKKAAVAGIEVDRHVHTFVVGEEREDISFKAKILTSRLRNEGGHVPRTDLVLKQLSEKEKEADLCGHAEKLALAYGLLNTPEGTPLLVTKNLRMCGDCHSSTEIMSRVERREIVVRDAHRVHRFTDGVCHCGGRP